MLPLSDRQLMLRWSDSYADSVRLSVDVEVVRLTYCICQTVS